MKAVHIHIYIYPASRLCPCPSRRSKPQVGSRNPSKQNDFGDTKKFFDDAMDVLAVAVARLEDAAA
jgi:hypothetical protein